VLALGAAGMAVCAQINRPLLRRYPRDRILKIANLVSVVLGVLLCVVAWCDKGGFLALIVPMLLILALRGLSLPLSLAAALMSEDRHIGVTSALVGAGSFALGAAFSALPSRFADGSARPVVATMLLALSLAALTLWRVAPTNAGAAVGEPV
jgi:DHA1 family bicyclomycin/chloramphenicol resistance-like MFS transporter